MSGGCGLHSGYRYSVIHLHQILGTVSSSVTEDYVCVIKSVNEDNLDDVQRPQNSLLMLCVILVYFADKIE